MSDVAQIRERLVQSELLSAEAADEQIARWQTAAGDSQDGAALIDWLVDQELLTEFQADAILAGHVGPMMLGPYRVLEQVHSGRLGGVFRAVHTGFDQPVSLKVFHSHLAATAEGVARIGREVRIVTQLDHPNVVRSFEIGRVGNTYYLALEDLRGQSLAARLERQERLPYEEACRILRDVAKALAHLDEHDVVHRDVGPRNIWLVDDREPKLIEFGAAVDAYAHLDELGDEDAQLAAESTIEHYRYMAPEQAHAAHRADARSDLYALGCTWYCSLTGRPPFTDADPVKQVLRHVYDQPPAMHELVADLPRQLDDTLAGLLAKEPARRFSRAADVVWALDQYVPKGEQAAPAAEAAMLPEVSPEYLEWVRSNQPPALEEIPEEAVGATPELTAFLDWMSARRRRRG